jgi:glycosyltransferase involved in cell wall biosynthesis
VELSVVIPTCNRPERLLSLLGDLSRSSHPILEILIVDSSDRALSPADYAQFANLTIRYVRSETKAVCVQRNIGIRGARGTWVFLCDDDIEVPADYVGKLAEHVRAHPEAGAVSGLCLEKTDAGWQSEFPVTSSRGLLWRYVFQLGVWGEIAVCGPLIDRIVERYHRRGNHISGAGWPVLVDFSGKYFKTPIYALGASVVKRDWLLASPYDERLDSRGMGDHYGVAIGFPSEGIHVVTDAAFRHQREQANRLADSEAYARRLMALHYFIKSRKELAHLREPVFLWSLFGQVVFHSATGNRRFARAAASSFLAVAGGRNPLLAGRGGHDGKLQPAGGQH